MRLLPVLFLAVLLPGAAFAQANSGAATNPIERCHQDYQRCTRNCYSGDTRTCLSQCDTVRAQCIQNPSAQQRRMQSPR